LALVAVACGDKGKPDDDKIAKAEGEEKAAEVEAKADGGGVEAWKMDVGKAARADVGAGAAEAGAVEAGAAEAGAAEAGAAEGAEAGAAEAGEPAPPDPATLLTEVKNKKTKDDRAMAALAEAETAGAKPKDLAKAAKARGDALHDAPERAKPFYEWASEKDPKSPDAAFALAKQAVNVGEIEEAKKHLQVVHERKGKKLLQQLAFDPMWEIVKDDPDVKGWYDADG
jgi:hypothetical protein